MLWPLFLALLLPNPQFQKTRRTSRRPPMPLTFFWNFFLKHQTLRNIQQSCLATPSPSLNKAHTQTSTYSKPPTREKRLREPVTKLPPLWLSVRESHSPHLPFSPPFTKRFQTWPRYWPRLFSVSHAIILTLSAPLLLITLVKPRVTPSPHPARLQHRHKLAKRLPTLSLRGLLLVIQPTPRAFTASKQQTCLQTLTNVPLLTQLRQAKKSNHPDRPANAKNHVKFNLMQS